MKKIIYLFGSLLLTLIAVSCSQENEGTLFDFGGKDYVTFRMSNYTFQASSENKVTVDLYHLNKNITGTTVDISVEYGEEAQGLFSVSTTQVTFGAENPVPIEITYNSEALDFNVDYIIKLSVPEQDYPTKTDIRTTTVKVVRPLTFKAMGTGKFISEAFEEEWDQPVRRAEQAEIYQLPDLYEEGLPVSIIVNGNGTVTVNPQPAWDHPSYGTVFVEGSGTKNGRTLDMNIKHYVPGVGSFGSFREQLILPE